MKVNNVQLKSGQNSETHEVPVSVTLCPKQHRWLTAALFVKFMTERNVCWWLLVNCTVVKVWSLFGCDTVQFGECLQTFRKLVVLSKLRWTLIWGHSSALCYCTALVCYCECDSPSVQVTAVSWMLSISAQTLHSALYRSIYSLLTWSYLGTLQGFLVLLWMWQSVCSSYCRQLNAVSFNTGTSCCTV